jgi:hypothetical protein
MIEETFASHSPRVVTRDLCELIIPLELAQMGARSFAIYEIEDFTFATRLSSGNAAQTGDDRDGYDKRRKQLSFHHILRVVDLRIGERN